MQEDNIFSQIARKFRQLIKGLLVGTNLATIILLWITCLTSTVSPVVHPRLSQAGLIFPVFLSVNLAFIFIWLITSWKWSILPVIGTICCWSYVRDFCPINLTSNCPTESIRILSYNVGNFATDSKMGFCGEKTLEYIIESNADIICLQECPRGHIYNKLKEKLEKEGYFFRDKNGIATISRWQFADEIIYQQDGVYSNGSFVNLIDINGDTILIINNHLQSNAISIQEKAEYANAIESYDTDKMEASGRILLSRLSQAAAKRSRQTDIVCSLVDKYKDYGIIIAGDFNDTPISNTYQRISKTMKCAFRDSGNGVGISFSLKGFPVRIDHIFVSKEMKTSSTIVDNKIESSDHHPIITHISNYAK